MKKNGSSLRARAKSLATGKSPSFHRMKGQANRSSVHEYMNAYAGTYLRIFDQAISLCESPIEEMLFSAICTVMIGEYSCAFSPGLHEWLNVEAVNGFEKHDLFSDGFRTSRVYLVPQWQIGNYRVDFCLFDGRRSEKVWDRIVIECDGHDFHERTKEQAAKDRSRDRALAGQNIVVFRFTGSEIVKDPYRCAEEIRAFLRRSGGAQG